MAVVTNSEKNTANIKFKKSKSEWVIVFERIKRNQIAIVSMYYILLNVFIAIFFPLIMPYDPKSSAPANIDRFGGGAYGRPSLLFPAGTSPVGYDVYSQLLAGTETSLLIGIFATLISIVIGVTIGLLAGYYKGWVEEVLMRITDLFLTLPFLIIALILIAAISNGQIPYLSDLSTVQIITIVIGLFGWAGLARLVTANVKQVGSLEYVDAIRLIGARDRRIIIVHILPNVLTSIIILSALLIAGAILSEAGLAFLGFGDPTTVSWGILVSNGRDKFRSYPEQALIPGFAIFFLVLAINLFGDAVRDALDPKLKE